MRSIHKIVYIVLIFIFIAMLAMVQFGSFMVKDSLDVTEYEFFGVINLPEKEWVINIYYCSLMSLILAICQLVFIGKYGCYMYYNMINVVLIIISSIGLWNSFTSFSLYDWYDTFSIITIVICSILVVMSFVYWLVAISKKRINGNKVEQTKTKGAGASEVL